MHKKITFALTACGRPDLLEQTIDSFLEFNTYPIERFKVIDDSAFEGVNDKLIEKYPQIEWIHNKERLGQTASIDIVYDDIDTEYIFHNEDDWQFLKSGFIEKSLELLEDDKILQVWLRGYDDVNGHPLAPGGEGYLTVTHGFQGRWHGFSWNPGLRRLSDYLRVKPFSAHGWESGAGEVYKDLGMHAVVLKDKYVKHIGWTRHIQDAKG